MSANSVFPPSEGIIRADKSEYLAGMTLKELSECHSRVPRLNSRRRFSRPSTWLLASRLEISLMCAPSRWFLASASAFVASSNSPKLRENAIWVSSVSFWSWKTSTPNVSMPFSISAACSRVNGLVMSIPDTSPPKNGLDTGSIGWMDSVMAASPTRFAFVACSVERHRPPVNRRPTCPCTGPCQIGLCAPKQPLRRATTDQ